MTKDVSEEIALAEQNIEEAEHALEGVLALIDTAPRADKVTVSRAVSEAFERLRAARSILKSLHDP
jgi:hypothetical protein